MEVRHARADDGREHALGAGDLGQRPRQACRRPPDRRGLVVVQVGERRDVSPGGDQNVAEVGRRPSQLGQRRHMERHHPVILVDEAAGQGDLAAQLTTDETVGHNPRGQPMHPRRPKMADRDPTKNASGNSSQSACTSAEHDRGNHQREEQECQPRRPLVPEAAGPRPLRPRQVGHELIEVGVRARGEAALQAILELGVVDPSDQMLGAQQSRHVLTIIVGRPQATVAWLLPPALVNAGFSHGHAP